MKIPPRPSWIGDCAIALAGDTINNLCRWSEALRVIRVIRFRLASATMDASAAGRRHDTVLGLPR